MDKFEHLKSVLLQQPGRMLSLDSLYALIDKVYYKDKVMPVKTQGYYNKHGQIIAKLEGCVLEGIEGMQAWKIKENN